MRVGDGHPCKYFRPPTLKLLSQISGASRFALNQVVCFSNVIGEIVKFNIATAIKILDQFPVPLANAAGRAVVVKMRVVPMQGVAVQLRDWHFQKWDQALAVDDLVFGKFAPSQIDECRIKVIADGRFVADGGSE